MPELKPDHLIVRYLSNEASPAEQEQLFEWVSRSKENQKVFNEYINLWSSQQKPNTTFNLETGLHKLNQRIDAFEDTENKKTVFWNRWNIAAAVILLIVSGFVLFHNGIFTYQDHLQSLQKETVAGNEMRQVKLGDGSQITLNRQSSLTYPEVFIAGTREVYLEGEAFFEVTKDSLRPFIVHANGTTTTVLGTSFNINALGKAVVVSVATGKVKVSDGDQTEILKADEKVTCENNTLKKELSDLSELSWNGRLLEFNDLTLAQAAEKLSAYYEVSVRFDQAAVKACRITGKFKNKKLETVLEAIRFSTEVHVKMEDSTVVFSGKGCQ